MTVVGFRPDGHCRHCGARPAHHIPTTIGVFCAACCHWITRSRP